MKEVIDLQGETIKVPVDTTVKTIDGKHYLLDEEEQEILNNKNKEYLSDEPRKKWGVIKAKRNQLLDATDWTQLPDASLSAVQKNEYKIYRQNLRDIPQDFDNPDNVVFPNKPQ